MTVASIRSISSIDPQKIRITPPSVSDPIATYTLAARYWFDFGFKVIPIRPGTKQPAVKWDSWLNGLTAVKIASHWAKHSNHEVGFIAGNDIIVFDADSPESVAALAALELTHGVTPSMVTKTTKGEHHYFQLVSGTVAKSDSHSSVKYPDRIDVKTGRALVILPPSTGKELLARGEGVAPTCHANDLACIGQDFINAICRHNGRALPLPTVLPLPSRASPASNKGVDARLGLLLDHLDPDSSYEDWLHCGMAIFQHTDGGEDGFELFDRWSSRGNKYKGEREIRSKWTSFDSGPNHRFNLGTLINMVSEKGQSWIDICDAAEPQFESCETEVIQCQKSPAIEGKALGNPLDRFSLRGMSSEIEKYAAAEVAVLGQIALSGQLTVIYSAPNTGKTLITLSLLIEAIQQNRVDPTKVYYLNMDDNSNGLLEKVRIAEEFGFHMLAESYNGFSTNQFLGHISEMIEGNQVSGVIIILDTLKKFADLMDKSKASRFTQVIRGFSQRGGTLIALAHTNKNPGKDGKAIYGGVSDIVNDFDCAYTLTPISSQEGSDEKVVEFSKFKARGNVVPNAAYSFSSGFGIPYIETLLSVQAFEEQRLEPLKQAEAAKVDTDVIREITTCIGAGINSKMKLAFAVAKRVGISQRAAIKIIEKYTGDDPSSHRWKFSIRERGAKVFVLLDSVPPALSAPTRSG